MMQKKAMSSFYGIIVNSLQEWVKVESSQQQFLKKSLRENSSTVTVKHAQNLLEAS